MEIPLLEAHTISIFCEQNLNHLQQVRLTVLSKGFISLNKVKRMRFKNLTIHN